VSGGTFLYDATATVEKYSKVTRREQGGSYRNGRRKHSDHVNITVSGSMTLAL